MKPYSELKRRIERDKARKAEARARLHAEHDGLDQIVTYGHWTKAILVSNRGSDFKRSVQVFNDKCILLMHDMIRKIRNGGLPDVATSKECWIRERGKARKITPVTVDDRSMQHVISDNALMPMLRRCVIRQNCANQRGKGTRDARQLLDRYLELAKRRWGSEIWVWTFDFRNFFGSIRHSECLRALRRLLDDERLIRLAMLIITSYQAKRLRESRKVGECSQDDFATGMDRLMHWEGAGICLGSQISQDMAITVPDPVDRLIKQSMPYYVRFADDGIVIWNNRDDLVQLMKACSETAAGIGLAFHPDKTQIRRAQQGFVFLKVRYVLAGRKTIKRLSRSSVVRMRRKLKKFRRLVGTGKMTADDAWMSLQSWMAHTRGTRSRSARKRMVRLYDELFGGESNGLLQDPVGQQDRRGVKHERPEEVAAKVQPGGGGEGSR